MTPPSFATALKRIRDLEPRVYALVDAERLIEGGVPLAGPTASGPLEGWPVAIKDVIDVEGVHTGCNAGFLPERAAHADAGIVRQLRDAGATILAKAVTTSFAFYDPGPTRNPWNLEHTPGGSSSGSAAAVAAGMVRLAVGTQTVGSINRPASFCGVVGFKPTYGRLPTEGVFPLSAPLDTVGFFTRSVADARDAFEALTGERGETGGAARLGVVGDLLCPAPDSDILATLRSTCAVLAEHGHTIAPLTLAPVFAEAYPKHWRLTAWGAAQAHGVLFSRYEEQYPAKLRELIETGLDVSDEELARTNAHRDRSRVIADQLFVDHDVLVSVSAPGAAPKGIAATGDPRCNLLWTYLGLPTVTLPAQLSSGGLPLGIQLTAKAGEDASLLALCEQIESTIGFSHVPALLEAGDHLGGAH